MAQVRVRFAPSPTGFLHIGGVRAALFNWLFARNQGGQFLLRIEDTDLERSEARYTQDIQESMRWFGLNWDEEPIFQSKRLPVYLQKAQDLVAAGHAYRCWCTEAEVEAMREVAIKAGKKPMYDRRCRALPADHAGPSGAPFVIRTKVPLEGHIEFEDMIRGRVRVENAELDDFVLIRSSGAPTYNLSVVVDDVESRMTHIIRGDDHINNTPKQLHLYRFFGYPLPIFAHLPMILGADKKKLSKRQGAVSANAYRAEGYLPEAMLNFLARIGWSHGDQEVFTVEEMVQHFSFDHVQKASGVFNTEKLLWTNGQHIRKAAPARLRDIAVTDFKDRFSAAGLKHAQGPLGLALTTLIQPKIKLLTELADQLAPLCDPGLPTLAPADVAALKWQKDPALKASSQAAIRQLVADLAPKAQGSLGAGGFKHPEIDAYFKALAERSGVKLGDLMQPIRLWVSGKMVSASVFELLEALPWAAVEARLLAAANAS